MSLINKLPIPLLKKSSWPWNEETSSTIYDPTISWPKISIVTPSYNQGKYIEETIRSVLLQNYPNLEFIIIDGGSNDETVDIIKKYEPWLTYWVSEPDKGQSHAINKGMAKCSGEIFNWLNSDDWYTCTTFYKIATCFINDTSVKVVSGFENHILLDGKEILYEGTFLKETVEQNLELCQISQPSTFFRLSILKEVGDVSEKLHFLMDAEIWMRYLVMNGIDGFIKIKESIVNFRLHDQSKTVNHIGDKFILERNSIVYDLQCYVELPQQVREYWLRCIFRNEDVQRLDIFWNFNSRINSNKSIRVYFIKKYINRHFQHKDFKNALWGINELLKNNCYDLFVFKSIIKLLVKQLI